MANIENNNLELLDYQEEAYGDIMRLLDEQRKAALISPPSYGKSFVILKYILEHPDERILYLSPRNVIRNQIYEYIIRHIGGETRTIEEIKKDYDKEISVNAILRMEAKKYIPNIESILYQTISAYGKKKKEETTKLLDSLKPNVIIIDEMHHLKTEKFRETGGVVYDDESEEIVEDDEEAGKEKNAEEQEEKNRWGEKFQKFISNNPQAKLIGLSATPIRTDGANVAERIFEDSIASEMSMLEAMEAGIIYLDKYVVADFIRKEELETLLQRIERAEGEEKIALKAKYDELVKQVKRIQGIPELMEEHIERKDSKFLIYCKDIKDEQEKMSKAQEWFGKIDDKPEIYGIHSKDRTSAQQLQNFIESKSEHLKLLYCVGMIDEGMHLGNIDGVILASKTGSRVTYVQRIGRAMFILGVKIFKKIFEMQKNKAF